MAEGQLLHFNFLFCCVQIIREGKFALLKFFLVFTVKLMHRNQLHISVPASAPSSPSCSPVSSSRILVTWAALQEKLFNGESQGYAVYVRPLLEWSGGWWLRDITYSQPPWMIVCSGGDSEAADPADRAQCCPAGEIPELHSPGVRPDQGGGGGQVQVSLLQDQRGPPLPPGQHQGGAPVRPVNTGHLASSTPSCRRNNRIRHPSLHNDGRTDHHGQNRGQWPGEEREER